jgi:tRNA-(ms[2]io[6]A)-hydroxylase
LLSEELQDQDLATFYKQLMKSEAGHYTLFLNFARSFMDRAEVDKKWQSLLTYEGEIMKGLGNRETMHG